MRRLDTRQAIDFLDIALADLVEHFRERAQLIQRQLALMK